MREAQALRILAEACRETLDEARTGHTWLINMVDALERLCGRLESELDART